MAKLTHLTSNCSSETDDIIEVLERDGAAIVDGFVSQAWLTREDSNLRPMDYERSSLLEIARQVA